MPDATPEQLTPDVIYTCPIPECSWSYTEPGGPPVAIGDAAMLTSPDALTEAISRAATKRTTETEHAVSEHCESHPIVDWLRTVQQLRQALGTARPNHPLLRPTSHANTHDHRVRDGRRYL